MLAMATEEGQQVVDLSYDHQAVLDEGLREMLTSLNRP